MASNTSRSLQLQLIVQAVDQAGQVLQGIKTGLDNLQNSAKGMGQAASDMGNKLQTGLNNAGGAADNLKGKLSSVGKVLQDVGGSIAAFGVTAGFSKAIGAAADFEKEMARVKAYTNFSPDTSTAQKQFQTLTDTAREVGRTSTFSASQAAQGITELGKAGYGTEQIVSSLGTALNLAYVEGQPLGQTAETLVKTVNQFGMGADEAKRAGDVLAYTSNATVTSMSELAEGLKYVGPGAKSLGMDIEQTAAYLGIFAQNGISATMGGTALRRVIGDLSAPSSDARQALAELNVDIVKNKDGNVNLTATFEALGKAGMTTAQSFKIFGDLGATVGLVAAQQVDKIKELAAANTAAEGSLAKMTATMNESLVPSLIILKNNVLDLANQFIGPFLSGIKIVVDALSSLVGGIVSLGRMFPGLSNVITGVIGVIGGLVVTLGAAPLVFRVLSFVLGPLLTGWTTLIGLGRSIIGMAPSKTAAIASETAAVNSQTVAVNALVAAQRQAALAGLAARQGGGGVVAPSGIGKGAGLASGMIAATGVGAGIASFAAAETSTQKIFAGVTGISGVIGAIPHPAAQIVSIVGQLVGLVGGPLIEKWFGVKKGIMDSADSAAQMRDTIAKSLSTGQSVEEFSEAYKRSFGEEIPNTVKESFILQKELAKAAGEESVQEQAKMVERTQGEYVKLKKTYQDFSEDYSRQFKQPPDAMLKGSFDRLAKEAEKAAKGLDPTLKGMMTSVIEYGVAQGNGYNQMVNAMLDSKKKLTGKRDMTDEERQQFDQLYKDIVLKTRAAVAEVGKEWEKLGKKTDGLSPEQKIQESKNAAEIQLKAAQDSAKIQDDLDKIAFDKRKSVIEQTVQSEILAKQRIDALVIGQSQVKISRAENEYAVTKAIRDKEYTEQSTILKEQIAKDQNVAESKKQLKDLEKRYAEGQIADNQKLAQSYISAINDQAKAREEHVKKLKDLDKQLYESQQQSIDMSNKLSQAYLNDYQKLQSASSIVVEKLAEAARLAPTMPERAIELFKQVRSESQGLIQNVESLNQKIRDNATFVTDAARKISLIGANDETKYKAELKNVLELEHRAQDAMAGGRMSEAENLYKQAVSAATALPGSAVKTGDAATDNANQEKAKKDAQDLVAVLGPQLNIVGNILKQQAEATNRQMEAANKEAQAKQENLLKLQANIALDQIKAIDDNTSALLALTAALQGKTQQPQSSTPGAPGTTPSTGTESGKAGQPGSPSAPGGTGTRAEGAAARLGGDYAPMKSEERGYSLSPDVQAMIDTTNDMISNSKDLSTFSQLEEEFYKNRMDQLKDSERQAGAMDKIERQSGGSISNQWENRIQSGVDRTYNRGKILNQEGTALIDMRMSGNDVDAAQNNIDSMLSRLLDAAKNSIAGLSNGVTKAGSSLLKDLKPPVSQEGEGAQSIGDSIRDILSDAGETFQSTINEAANAAFERAMQVDIIVKDNRNASLGSIMRPTE